MLIEFLFYLFLCLLLLYWINPFLLYLRYITLGRVPHEIGAINEAVTFIIIARNAEKKIKEKIINTLDLDWGDFKFEILFFSDGSTDQTVPMIQSLNNPLVKIIEEKEHCGKNHLMNQALRLAQNDILIFSDADTLLKKDAIKLLLRHFKDSTVGGVCGVKTIIKDHAKLSEFERLRVEWDNTIKEMESLVGSITSNDGTLYAIRKQYVSAIALDATDDLYACLEVLSHSKRFIYEPLAIASLSSPSRDIKHEIQRRRRIVNRSLTGIWRKNNLLNPFKYGFISIQLLINKVFRRLMPFFLIGMFISSLCIFQKSTVAFYFLIICLCLFILICMSAYFQEINIKPIKWVYWGSLGIWGMLLGCVDFFSGKRVQKWQTFHS